MKLAFAYFLFSLLLYSWLLLRWAPTVSSFITWGMAALGLFAAFFVLVSQICYQKYVSHVIRYLLILIVIFGILGNIIAFDQIERSDLWKLRAASSDSLADLLEFMPRNDAYPGGAVLVWLKRNASGSSIIANEDDLLSVGLVPFQLIGFSEVSVQKREPILPLDNAVAFVYPETVISFKMMGVRRQVVIDTEAARPGSKLCAFVIGEELIIVGEDRYVGCRTSL